MSSQRGNVKRTRSQKHKNVTAFKNDLHFKTPKVKLINSIEITDVCRRCHDILKWKIKFNKYKPLKAVKKCVKCGNKCVKNAYNIMCLQCAHELNVCPKCVKREDNIETTVSRDEQLSLDAEIHHQIKKLPERKYQTFQGYSAELLKDSSSDSEKEPEPDLPAKLEFLQILCEENVVDLDDSYLHNSCEDNIKDHNYK